MKKSMKITKIMAIIKIMKIINNISPVMSHQGIEYYVATSSSHGARRAADLADFRCGRGSIAVARDVRGVAPVVHSASGVRGWQHRGHARQRLRALGELEEASPVKPASARVPRGGAQAPRLP